MSQIAPLSANLQSLDEALSYVKEKISPINRSERIEISEACGRILAQEIYGLRSVPPFNNSAVDGFGISFDNYREGIYKYNISQHILAGGDIFPHEPGSAVKITTGATVPEGIDAVIMKEDCTVDGNCLKIPQSGLSRNMNIRFVGEDVRSGEIIIPKNHKICSPDIALIISQGLYFIDVFSPLRIGVFSTGSELIDVSADTDASSIMTSIIDCNRPMLISSLREMGYQVTDLGIIIDDKDHLKSSLLKHHEDFDIIITSGGMSAGDADLVFSVISELGELYIHGLAIKPGRPIGFGRIGDCLICGLPGNPVAVYTCLLFAVNPILKYLCHLDGTVSYETILSGFDYKKRKSIREFVRISTKKDNNNQTIGEINGKKGAAMVSSLHNLSGFAIMMEGIEKIQKGSPIKFVRLKELIS